MVEPDKKILAKLEELMKNQPNTAQATEFLSQLNAADYDYLIDLFKNNNFTSFSQDTKEKLLIILKSLRYKLL